MKRNWNPYELLVKMQNDAATVENIWLFLKHLKIELPYELAPSLLGLHPKEWKIGTQTDQIFVHPYSGRLYSQWLEGESNLSVHLWMNG